MGDTIKCSKIRYSADEIETGLVDRLTEILLRAGHFENVSENIRKQVSTAPEEIKRQIEAIQADIQKTTITIRRTFKIQAEMDADSEGIKLVAQELQELGRMQSSLEARLQDHKSQESYKDDVDNSIVDLKTRIEQFTRGWKKASVMMRKSLFKDLLFAVVIVPKGLQIEYRLKEGLNSEILTP